MEENQTKNNIILSVAYTIITIVVQVAVAVIGGDNFPPLISAVITLITIAYLCIVFVTIYYGEIVPYNNQREDEDTFYSSDNAEPLQVEKYKCDRFPSRYCSAAFILNSDFYEESLRNRKLTEEEANKYNLMTDDSFNEKEAVFFNDLNNGEMNEKQNKQIWIVSAALETEVELDEDKDKKVSDPSLRTSMKTVERNIKAANSNSKRRVCYVQFVSSTKNRYLAGNFKKRKRKYWSALDGQKLTDEEKQKWMPIIEIDSDKLIYNNYGTHYEEDWAYLTQMTSTLFLLEPDDEGKLDLIEGYFCLRPESEPGKEECYYRTIFYKMPKACMAVPLFDVLKEEYNLNNNA